MAKQAGACKGGPTRLGWAQPVGAAASAPAPLLRRMYTRSHSQAPRPPTRGGVQMLKGSTAPARSAARAALGVKMMRLATAAVRSLQVVGFSHLH